MRMRRISVVISLALLVTIFLVHPVFSSPFTRPSSLINIPTSDILKKGEVEVGISALGQEDISTEADGWINFGLFNKVELGLVLLTPYEVVGNAKLRILEEKKNRPALSVGVLNITDKERISSTGDASLWKPMNYTLYAVLGKEIPYLGKGYLGIGNRWFEAHGSEDKKGSGIFLGIKKEIKPLTLSAEFDGKYPNIGMELEFPQGVKLKVALTELRYLNEKYEDELDKEIKFALGLSFTNKLSVDARKKDRKTEKELAKVKAQLKRARMAAKRVRAALRKQRLKAKGRIGRPEVYMVKKGDCLWFIAGYEKIYGNPFLWKKIFKANRDKIRDPDLIYPYQKLKIPRD
jgi:hypothetical protein